MGLTVWPDAVVERLRQLVADRLSGSRIADRLYKEFSLEKSRCAVIGKATRLGVRLHGASYYVRPKNGNKPGPQPGSLRARQPRWRQPEVYEITPQEPEASCRCSLLDLVMTSCRWPIGDPRDPGLLFCGAHNDGGPYCSYHHMLSVDGAGTAKSRARRGLSYGYR